MPAGVRASRRRRVRPQRGRGPAGDRGRNIEIAGVQSTGEVTGTTEMTGSPMHLDEIVLNDYVDDTLGRDARANVERHLTTCLECRRLVDEVRELRRRVSSLE